MSIAVVVHIVIVVDEGWEGAEMQFMVRTHCDSAEKNGKAKLLKHMYGKPSVVA